ncbi:MAG: hypothetical protein HKN00_08345 [Flavobacteriaceae bacterium]|nr:hypothetical protein [Bacteroidia bacterium]MBT8286651.1 hypothetical protein [Bacteroidia bacterium]NNF75176.1 hypothetical protein [Flavobacteriaceae bacterium]NNK72451.1 hypothetical protein [Flavobacteriaceae bacterium]
MKKLLFFSLFLSVIIYSCKNGSKSEASETDQITEEGQTTQSNEEDTSSFFTLTINALVELDDEFILYYLEEGQKDIKKENSVAVKLSGSPSIQQLEFKLKDDTLPTNLILRFAQETPEQKVTFMNSVITYGSSEFIIDAPRFFQFFNPNECINFNKEENSATVKEVNGRLNPSFNSREVLNQRLDLLL